MAECVRPQFSMEPTRDNGVMLRIRDSAAMGGGPQFIMRLSISDARLLGMGLWSIVDSIDARIEGGDERDMDGPRTSSGELNDDEAEVVEVEEEPAEKVRLSVAGGSGR